MNSAAAIGMIVGGFIPVLLIAGLLALIPIGRTSRSARFLFTAPLAGIISASLGGMSGGFFSALDLFISYGIPAIAITGVVAILRLTGKPPAEVRGLGATLATPEKPSKSDSWQEANFTPSARAADPKRRGRGVVRRLWSQPRERENSLQTLFRMLGNILRVGVAAVLGTVFAALGIVASVYGFNWLSDGRKSENLIDAQISFDGTSCTQEYPALIQITNRSNDLFSGGNFGVTIQDRASSEYLEIYDARVTVDAMIPPGYTYHYCDNDSAGYIVLSIEGRRHVASLRDYKIEIEPYITERDFTSFEPWMVEEAKRSVADGVLLATSESRQRGWIGGNKPKLEKGADISGSVYKIPIDDSDDTADYGIQEERIAELKSTDEVYLLALAELVSRGIAKDVRENEYLIAVTEGLIIPRDGDKKYGHLYRKAVIARESKARALAAARIDLETGRIRGANEARPKQLQGVNSIVDSSSTAVTKRAAAANGFIARKTVHGIYYEIPEDWNEVAASSFADETAKLEGRIPSDVKAFLNDTDLIFAIGISEGSYSNSVLTMRVGELAPADAVDQNDLGGLSEPEQAELLKMAEESMGGISAMTIPGMASLELFDVSLTDTGNLLCIEARFNAVRDDGNDAVYTNWNCPLDRLNLSLSFHVRSDLFDQNMPVVTKVLASLEDQR